MRLHAHRHVTTRVTPRSTGDARPRRRRGRHVSPLKLFLLAPQDREEICGVARFAQTLEHGFTDGVEQDFFLIGKSHSDEHYARPRPR